jgi:hypothetical protein
MKSSHLDAKTMLAVDIGEISTRAMLFDVVNGLYRFLAVGTATTTAAAPYYDIGQGVRLALDRLQEVTGRTLVGADELIIMPVQADGSGVDTIAATLSVGPPIKVVAVGLLDDVSLESAQNLAASTYASVVESVSLNDRRKPEERVDTILRARPDVIIIAGGTDGGASQSVLRLVESVSQACLVLPEGERPDVLFAGNQSLTDSVKSSLGPVTSLHIAANIRPTLEVERLGPARFKVGQIFRNIRAKQIPGIHELDIWADGQLAPTATAFGRVIRFLSKVYDPAKGVLGLDVGASATTIAAGFADDLILGVYPQFGLGKDLPDLLKYSRLKNIKRWLSVEISDDYVRDYIYNKSLYPVSLPVTGDDLAIEQALVREIIRAAVSKTIRHYPKEGCRARADVLPWFEPIVAGGSVLTNAPTVAQCLLMLLDALQPCGVTTLVLDRNRLAAPLGAAAGINPVLVVQVLESSTFASLGSVIAPVANVRPGIPVLRIHMTYESGKETDLEIKHGNIELIPLPQGQSANIRLRPLHRTDVGMGGPGRGGTVRVVGGALGVIVDARGRPLSLPKDIGQRRELMKKWQRALGD